MVNRTDTNIVRENKAKEKGKTASTPASQRSPKNRNTNDDLIVSLSDSYENKRAQQVSEWQSIQPKVMQRAA
ncbi:MAG TPA: hypothetical protein VGQ55_14720 [Pyrinomonadaceae bacterium]|jgi:hypothetical protein|nr:hypothetical protein [Pyrinomonadaceae bacterium]